MNERELKRIIKEEIMKEMDITTGLAVAGGAFLAYKGLAYLVAIVSGIKEGIKAGLEDANFRKRSLETLILDPKVLPILKKLRDASKGSKDDIINAIASGDLDTAAEIMKESGILTPEEIKTIEEKFNFHKGMQKLHHTAVSMKRGLPDR